MVARQVVGGAGHGGAALEQPQLELAQRLLAALVGVGDQRAHRDAARDRRFERLLDLGAVEAEDHDVDDLLRLVIAADDGRDAVVGLDDQLHFGLAFFSDHSTEACPSGSSFRRAVVIRSRSTSSGTRFVADRLVGRGQQLRSLHDVAAGSPRTRRAARRCRPPS